LIAAFYRTLDTQLQRLLCAALCVAAVPAEVQPLQVRSDTSSITTGIRNGSSFIVTQFALPLLVSLFSLGGGAPEHCSAFACRGAVDTLQRKQHVLPARLKRLPVVPVQHILETTTALGRPACCTHTVLSVM
jgi:hypothetical protein